MASASVVPSIITSSRHGAADMHSSTPPWLLRQCRRGLLLFAFALPAMGETWDVAAWERPFDYASESRLIEYTPLTRATDTWQLCAIYPHLKDSYWLSVNYGMVETARHLGIGLQVFEAGGYHNVERQRDHLHECVANGADAIMLGTVSYDELSDTVVEIAGQIPVVAIVNDIAERGISAKVGVPWTDMGYAPAAYLARQHPVGGAPVDVAWFPGPKGGWAHFVDAGFHEALAGSAARVVATKWGDTGVETQHIQVEEVLDSHPDVDYLVGSAITAEAATGLLRARELEGEIGLLATYFTHGVYRGIRRGKVLAAPNDFPALQGRLSVDMTVRVLEDALLVRHAGPVIQTVDADNVATIPLEHSLSPATFSPIFNVDPTPD
jgi:periplasmic protein TorT